MGVCKGLFVWWVVCESLLLLLHHAHTHSRTTCNNTDFLWEEEEEDAPEPACIGVRPQTHTTRAMNARLGRKPNNIHTPPPGSPPEGVVHHQPICSLARPPGQVVAAARQPLNLGEEGVRQGGRGVERRR